MSRKYIKLTNGALFALEDIVLVGRKELNEYSIVVKGLQGATVNADGNDYDAIVKALGEEVIIVERKPEIVPKSKLEIAD